MSATLPSPINVYNTTSISSAAVNSFLSPLLKFLDNYQPWTAFKSDHSNWFQLLLQLYLYLIVIIVIIYKGMQYVYLIDTYREYKWLNILELTNKF